VNTTAASCHTGICGNGPKRLSAPRKFGGYWNCGKSIVQALLVRQTEGIGSEPHKLPNHFRAYGVDGSKLTRPVMRQAGESYRESIIGRGRYSGRGWPGRQTRCELRGIGKETAAASTATPWR